MNKTEFLKLLENAKQEERKQVCEKIKSEILNITGCTENELIEMIYDLDAKTIFEILDKIEKGEGK